MFANCFVYFSPHMFVGAWLFTQLETGPVFFGNRKKVLWFPCPKSTEMQPPRRSVLESRTSGQPSTVYIDSLIP